MLSANAAVSNQEIIGRALAESDHPELNSTSAGQSPPMEEIKGSCSLCGHNISCGVAARHSVATTKAVEAKPRAPSTNILTSCSKVASSSGSMVPVLFGSTFATTSKIPVASCSACVRVRMCACVCVACSSACAYQGRTQHSK